MFLQYTCLDEQKGNTHGLGEDGANTHLFMKNESKCRNDNGNLPCY